MFDIQPLTQHMVIILISGLVFNTIVFQLLYNTSERIHAKMIAKRE
jgi:hypothetical protein